MNLLRLMILTAGVASFGTAFAVEAKSSCVVMAQDPVIQSFFRSNGYEVDDVSGDFQVEFEVTCEAVETKQERIGITQRFQTTVKVELFNEYEDQRVVYHAEELISKSGRVVGPAFVVPCADSKPFKEKLLQNALKAAAEINCSEE